MRGRALSFAMLTTIFCVACGDDGAGGSGGGGGTEGGGGSETGGTDQGGSGDGGTAEGGGGAGGGGAGGGAMESGIETEHGGLDLAEWMKLYWTWNLGASAEDTVQDRTFLPIPAGTDEDGDDVYTGEADVTLDAANGFVLPTFVWIGETYENGDPPDDDKSMPPTDFFTATTMVVTLDGETILDGSVDDLNDFFFEAIDFDETIDYAQPTDYGAIGAIWVKGIGFLHGPLEPGEHVLHLEEFNDGVPIGYSNTWNITVE